MPPPPSKPTIPKTSEPKKYSRTFDPWNAVSLGHQRAETRGPDGWRANRTRKLQSQFAAGNTGGERLSDTVGAGSADYDERLGVVVPREVRARAANSVMDMLRKPGTMGRSLGMSGDISLEKKEEEEDGDDYNDEYGGGDIDNGLGIMDGEKSSMVLRKSNKEDEEDEVTMAGNAQNNDNSSNSSNTNTNTTNTNTGKIFDGLVIYVNGSTYPLVSDHKLKKVLVENGARMSIHLGRRQVTHVILGRPSGPNAGGAGGGLAGGKLEKEIRRVGGSGIKYVGVEW